MLCNVCIGVLQYRQNILVPGTIDDEVVSFGESEESEDDEEQWIIGESQAHKIDELPRLVKMKFGHHRTSTTLALSAAAECHICQPIWDRCSSSEKEHIRAIEEKLTSETTTSDHVPQDVARYEFLTTATMKIRSQDSVKAILDIRYNHHEAWDSFTWPYWNTYMLEPATLDNKSTKYPSSHHTSSEESLQTASSWLQECLSKHKACNRGVPDIPWYPTRLLDLTNTHPHKDTIRLIKTAEEPPKAPYGTLSHRWGGANFLHLTKATLPSFCTSISILELPRTFREAIFVARRLDIRYLWIDSLCIMQDRDDLTDWYHEASRMDQVYMQSICNISATDARDGTEGLFRYRSPHHIYPAHVDLCVKGVKCSSELIDCTVLYSDLLRHNISRTAVGGRGWILQERLLARRVLHFSSHQACERYPHGFPDHPNKDEFKVIHDYSVSEEPIRSRPGSLPGRDYWAELVQLYTSMSLTDPNDKLVALSGIAKARAARFGGVYVAGMWRQDLAHQLLWNTGDSRKFHNDSIKPRPDVYRAPSWSWASIDRPVFSDTKTDDDHLLYHVEDVCLTHATEDITGRILSGWLQLRACLKTTRIVWHRLYEESDDDDFDHWDLILDEADSRLHSDIIFDAPPSSRTSFDDDNARNKLFYIPTVKWTRKSSQRACGLLLRVVDVDNGIFERLGYIYDGNYKHLPAMLADLREEVKRNLPCVRYEDGLHTIRII